MIPKMIPKLSQNDPNMNLNLFTNVLACSKLLIGSIGMSLLMAQVTKSSVARLAPESLAKGQPPKPPKDASKSVTP